MVDESILELLVELVVKDTVLVDSIDVEETVVLVVAVEVIELITVVLLVTEGTEEFIIKLVLFSDRFDGIAISKLLSFIITALYIEPLDRFPIGFNPLP